LRSTFSLPGIVPVNLLGSGTGKRNAVPARWGWSSGTRRGDRMLQKWF